MRYVTLRILRGIVPYMGREDGSTVDSSSEHALAHLTLRDRPHSSFSFRTFFEQVVF